MGKKKVPQFTMPPKKDLGQYFTISEELQKVVFDLVHHKNEPLLEPSFGAGHLLRPFLAFSAAYPMALYELDETIKPVIAVSEHQNIRYGDFLTQTISERYKTIVGNPPYVKQRTGNLYLKFIERCVELLDDDGELIFIVPSDFLKLTRAASVITAMTAVGSFTDFYFPHNERLFEGANIDVVVFRYQKGARSDCVSVNEEEKQCIITKGIITFKEVGTVASRDTSSIVDVIGNQYTCYVGLVTGRDEVYKVGFGNMTVLCDKDRVETFLFSERFPTGRADLDAHLLAHKDILLARKIRTFSESNWYEWGAPRNIQHMRAYMGKPCIYVRTMTRKKEVAFVGVVQYFGGTLLCLVPRGEENLSRLMEHLNSEAFQKDYIYAGRFKIGHKQLCNAVLTADFI